MSWASKRQNSVLALLTILALIPVIFIAYKFLSIPATCSDRMKNQSEVGVDCGGPCSLLCKSQVVDPIVTWKRFFSVGGGVYNVVAYIENPNSSAGAEKVGYTVRVINQDGISMYERHGTTVIPAKRAVPVVESGINLGGQTPSRVEFKLSDSIVWKKEEVKETPLLVSNISLTGATSSPRLVANIENKDVVPYSNIEVVALLYDEQGNAIGASRTYVDSVSAGASVSLTFTWPTPFTQNPARIEVIPKLFI